MALISCDECDRWISDSASACPGCGAPQPETQAGGCAEATLGCLIGMVWLAAGLLVLALLVLVAFFVFAAVL